MASIVAPAPRERLSAVNSRASVLFDLHRTVGVAGFVCREVATRWITKT